MVSAFKTYDRDTEDTLWKRRRFLTAIEKAGISDSDNEVERILAFYASDIQQLEIVPPPPLPPRTDDLASVNDSLSEIRSTLHSTMEDSTSTSHVESEGEYITQFTSLRLNHERCFRDEELSSNLVRSNYMPGSNQPELLQAFQLGPSQIRPAFTRPAPRFKYTTDNGVGLGPKCRILVVDAVESYPSALVQYYLELFRVWTANTGGPWIFKRIQSAYLVTGHPVQTGGHPVETRFTSISHKICHDPSLVNQVFLKDRKAVDGKNLSEESNHILDSLRGDRFRTVQQYDLRKYDYIIASHQDQIPILKRHRSKESLAQILVLSMPIWRKDVLDSKDMMRVAFKSIEEFITINFGWQRPQRSSTQGPFKTVFVRVRLSSSLYESELVRQFKKAEQDSGCGLHWTSHPCQENEKILAIVGVSERLAGAEHIVDDVLIKCNWGHVMTQTPK